MLGDSVTLRLGWKPNGFCPAVSRGRARASYAKEIAPLRGRCHIADYWDVSQILLVRLLQCLHAAIPLYRK